MVCLHMLSLITSSIWLRDLGPAMTVQFNLAWVWGSQLAQPLGARLNHSYVSAFWAQLRFEPRIYGFELDPYTIEISPSSILMKCLLSKCGLPEIGQFSSRTPKSKKKYFTNSIHWISNQRGRWIQSAYKLNQTNNSTQFEPIVKLLDIKNK